MGGDRNKGSGEPAAAPPEEATVSPVVVRKPVLPGAAGRPDTGNRNGGDYVESQPGGERDDLMDRQNRPPGGN